MALAEARRQRKTGFMTKMTKRVIETTAVLAALYCARRYYRDWGATKFESRMLFPGDTMAGDPAIQTTEAVYIDAPASSVWPRLLQSVQDRRPFTGVRDDVGRMGEQPEQLSVGDIIRLVPEGWFGLSDGVPLKVVKLEPEKFIVLAAQRPELRWDAVFSFHLMPHWEDRVRLLVRARVSLSYPGEVLVMEALRPLLALGTRALLLSVKHGTERAVTSAVVTPGPVRSQAYDAL